MTIKNRIFIFSILFLAALTIIGAFVYVISVQQLGRETWKTELSKLIDTKKISIQTSVNRDIALAMKWADSTVTKEFFMEPSNPELRKLALREFTSYKNAFSNSSNFWVNDVDKEFYSNDKFSYVVNPNNKDDYWYNMTLYETEKFNFNINYNPNLDETCLCVNAPVFNNKRPIGIVGTGIVLDEFIAGVYNQVDETIQIYFFNKNHEITGAWDK